MTPELTPNGAYPSSHQAESNFRPFAAAGDLQGMANNLEEYLRPLVRERPVTAVFAAAGVGYILARILARRTR